MTSLCSFIFTAMVVLVLAGCGASSRLRSAHGNKYRYVVSLESPVRSDSMLYRDERLLIQFRFDDPAIRFQVQNLTSGAMTIDWPAVRLDLGGGPTPVRSLLTLFDTTGIAQAGAPVQSLGVVRDIILPASNASVEAQKWTLRDLLPTADGNDENRAATIRSWKGKKIDLVVPLKFGAETHSYRFTFRVDSVNQILWSEFRPPAWIPPAPPVATLTPSTQEKITAALIIGGFAGFVRYVITMKKSPVVE